jgi:hypothetical protein
MTTDDYYAGRPAPDAALALLRRDYPAFQISAEDRAGRRTRFTASRRDGGYGVHTVMTDDLAELREALGQ